MPALGLANCIVTLRGTRFSPLSLANLAGWWDVSQSAGVTTGTGGISSLNDLSGNGRNLTQGTSTKRPALTVAGQNGLNVATFDGVDDFLSGAWVRAQPLSVFAALAVRANSAGSSTVIGLDTWAGTGHYLYLSTGLRTNTLFFAGGATIGPIDLSSGAFAQVSIVSNGASSIIGRNGTESTGNSGAMSASALSLGDATDEGSVNSAITVGEVIALSEAASAATREAVKNYLRGKWGI
ncbi:MAG: hypothetical protein NTU84_00675 [Verrucomicrobia bacterium]|nr:hypothetical protein [Verrucomicrobiota bacterium]